MMEKWKKEKAELASVKEKQKEVENYRKEYEDALLKADYNRAGELIYKTIPELEKKLTNMKQELVMIR